MRAFKCGRGSVPGAALTHHRTLVELESYPHGAGGQQPEVKVWAGLGPLEDPEGGLCTPLLDSGGCP